MTTLRACNNDDDISTKHLKVKIIKAENVVNTDSGILGDVSDPFVEARYVLSVILRDHT
jgi:hypothetical protein